MTESNYTLHVSVGEVSIEVSGSKEFVDNKFDELEATYLEDTTDPDAYTADTSQRSGASKGLTLSEVYTAASISYKREAALFVGYFLEQFEGQDDFTKSEIEERAVQAKVELGKNLSRDLSKLINQGYLSEVGERNGESTYYLTRTGENHVEEDFGVEGLVDE